MEGAGALAAAGDDGDDIGNALAPRCASAAGYPHAHAGNRRATIKG